MSSSRVFQASRALMAAAKASASTTTKKASSSTTSTTAAVTKRVTGIQQVKPISPALGKFLGGASESSRSEAVKKIWEHIKNNKLQTPEDKRIIVCDEKLKSIFNGKAQVGFLEIARLLSPHFTK
ncbi:hypothetical protein AQUCO_00600478v1 [Aquilegia coerulea]|uniref:DM2 domain-containing protein n=1 Tax=Aquilegia coerulea TaxID=218851 RepID=A0A2G5EPT9_AQUCA|nr:hypothetical protein AQUCO_00600478v1 [Aquilegia coerulea]